MLELELFLKAMDAYKAWIATGKDFVCHADLFEVWDKAINAFAEARSIPVSWAKTEVYVAVGAVSK